MWDDDDIEAASLQDQRHDAVLAAIAGSGARSVIDLGCGAGDLLARLLGLPGLERIVGLDLSPTALALARDRLPADPRLALVQGTYLAPSPALRGFDAAALIETIEHVDPGRLGEVERAIFADARPGTVAVTTPNREYNVHYGLGPDRLRHPDHRFEWDRARFSRWVERVATRHGYAARIRGIGDPEPGAGAPTQLAVFTRR